MQAQLRKVQIPEMQHTQRLLQQRRQQSPFRPARQLLQWRMPLGKKWLRVLRGGARPPDTAGGAGEGAAASEENMPISPLTGSRTREYKVSLIVDYRKRLEDLDTQILKMREEETDSNVYSIKTSAETELKLWEGELNSIYNALMEMLSQEDAAKLASEQQEWLKNRDARAAESSGRNSGSMEGISYAATLASLTRDRAYELAGRYEEANGVFYEEEDSSQPASP